MWRVGDRIRRSSSIHGEMIGTISAVTAGVNQTIYHVTWETSKTGTIQSRELGGRDDRNWESLSSPDQRNQEGKVKAQLSPEITSALDRDTGLSSRHTRRAYQADLAGFEAWCAGQPLSEDLVQNYLVALAEQGKSPGRINRALAAIRWWARQKMDLAVAAVHMPPATMVQIFTESLAITRIPDLPTPRARPAPELPVDQFNRLLTACNNDPSPAGFRDGTILSLARFQGLKPGRLLLLRREALTDPDQGGYQLAVPGPRGQIQVHAITQPASALCEAWVALRDQVLPAQIQGQPLFLAINKGGRILKKGLSGEALRQVLKKRQVQAGLTGITWHSIGRSGGNEAFQR